MHIHIYISRAIVRPRPARGQRQSLTDKWKAGSGLARTALAVVTIIG